MHRVDLFGRKALEQTVVDHRFRARIPLFAGLKDQVHGPVEPARARQILRGADEHRRVPIVATTVHQPLFG